VTKKYTGQDPEKNKHCLKQDGPTVKMFLVEITGWGELTTQRLGKPLKTGKPKSKRKKQGRKTNADAGKKKELTEDA